MAFLWNHQMFLQLFSKKSLFLLHFMVFCRGKLAENALRNSHRCHRFSQMLLLGKNLPQNTRISQNLLLRIFSHRFHSAQMLTSGGALVSARLCRLPEQEVHQHSKQWFSHRFHRSTQNFLLRMFSHRLHGIHRNSCWVEPPTDFTDLHRCC